MRIGLLTDTHLPSLMKSLDELGPQVGEFLSTVDLILHGGDVVVPSVLDWCEQFAPLVAVRGNHDVFDDPRLKDRQVLDLEGWRLGMRHDLRPEDRPMEQIIERDFGDVDPQILIAGDTHVDRLEFRDGVLLINSGSPNLPHHKETRLGTVGLLELRPGYLRAEILCLGPTQGARNPGTSRHIELIEGHVVSASIDGEAIPVPEPME